MTTTKTLGTVLQEQNFREQMRNVMEAVTADSVKAKLYETAETIEEYYEIFKDRCIVKLEQFKSLCGEIVAYFNQPKVELDDELMEIISGGNIFKKIGKWCKKNWKAIAITAAAVVGVALICTGIGIAAAAEAADTASMLSWTLASI
ncbi:MAG: hypothetical protein II352_05075 [Selenomonadaceae bacterium]|nr:hypothetical protein [Selenomonadaceae bacterium]